MTNSQLLEWARSKGTAHRFILFENGVRVPDKYGPGQDGFNMILTKDVCNQWTQETDGSWLYDPNKGCDCGALEKQISDQAAVAAIQDLVGAYDVLLAKVTAEKAAQKPAVPVQVAPKQPLAAAQIG